jgi:hypothetical protein
VSIEESAFIPYLIMKDSKTMNPIAITDDYLNQISKYAKISFDISERDGDKTTRKQIPIRKCTKDDFKLSGKVFRRYNSNYPDSLVCPET